MRDLKPLLEMRDLELLSLRMQGTDWNPLSPMRNSKQLPVRRGWKPLSLMRDLKYLKPPLMRG